MSDPYGIVPDSESITAEEAEELRVMLSDPKDWRGVTIIRALMAQVRLFRSLIQVRPQTDVPAAIRVALPRCEGVASSLCALDTDDARIDKRSFGNPNAWECRGCGHVGNMPETAG